jgi:hypothetical protein
MINLNEFRFVKIKKRISSFIKTFQAGYDRRIWACPFRFTVILIVIYTFVSHVIEHFQSDFIAFHKIQKFLVF